MFFTFSMPFSEEKKMTEYTYLSEKQKIEILELINNGAKKKEVEMAYFALTKQTLKVNTYKKYRKVAKKYADGAKAREYTLPAAQQAFENKACGVLEAYAKTGDLRHNTNRDMTDFIVIN